MCIRDSIIGWSLGYAVNSLTGGYVGIDSGAFFVNYVTDPKNLIFWIIAVSYTHLDVYKRQIICRRILL